MATNQPFVTNWTMYESEGFYKFFKSFPAYHLQKNRFKIFDVSLIYSGSHFGANAYFKMTGLKDPVFLLSPLNFPKGIPAQLTFFLLLQLLCRVTLGSPLTMPFNDLLWRQAQSSPVQHQPEGSLSNTTKGKGMVFRIWRDAGYTSESFRGQLAIDEVVCSVI